MLAWLKKYKPYTPMILIMFSLVCYLISDTDWYYNNYEMFIQIIPLIFCLYMYLDSESWSFLPKRTLTVLILLSILNIIDCIFLLEGYYVYFSVPLYSSFFLILIYNLIKK